MNRCYQLLIWERATKTIKPAFDPANAGFWMCAAIAQLLGVMFRPAGAGAVGEGAGWLDTVFSIGVVPSASCQPLEPTYWD